MTNPNFPSDDGLPASSSRTRSTAEQVVYWVRVASLLVAVSTMAASWLYAALPITATTAFIFMFATLGLWVTVFRLLILGIKRMVKSRVAESGSERA